MALDLSSPLSPAPTIFSSPDFITTHSRKSFHPAAQTPKVIADQRHADQHGNSTDSDATFVCPNEPCGSENCKSQACRARLASGVSQRIVDRRAATEPAKGFERRQFGSSHANLSPAAAELAVAIDQYKLQHRRRYITCEEMLMVITKLGYSR